MVAKEPNTSPRAVNEILNLPQLLASQMGRLRFIRFHLSLSCTLSLSLFCTLPFPPFLSLTLRSLQFIMWQDINKHKPHEAFPKWYTGSALLKQSLWIRGGREVSSQCISAGGGYAETEAR